MDLSPITDRVVSPCTSNVCMQRITVDSVFNEIRRLYDKRIGTTLTVSVDTPERVHSNPL